MLLQEIDGTYTDQSGNFSIQFPVGTQKTTIPLYFVYGYIDDNAKTKSEKRNVLKYNGYDYIVTEAPKKEGLSYKTNTDLEICTSANGCEQVMLLIDCSGSVRNETITRNGGITTKMDAIIESAKKLVDNLTNSNKNIYIGLVFFSGDSYLARNLTKDARALKEDLNNIKNSEWGMSSNTDFAKAIKKAKESFVYNGQGANRHIVIISDGTPTAAEDEKIYFDDTIDGLEYKINQIGVNTIDAIENTKNDGINIKSVCFDSNDDVQNNYINSIFRDHVNYFKMTNEDSFSTEIEQELVKKLISEVKENQFEQAIEIPVGYESSKRRAEVDALFTKSFSYNRQDEQYLKTRVFESIEDKYDFNENDAKEFCDLTYMIVEGGNYEIDYEREYPAIEKETVTQEVQDPNYPDDPDKRILIQKEVTTHHVLSSYEAYLGLAYRPSLDLQLKSAITAEKATAKGIVFSQQTKDGLNTDFIKLEIDQELTYGTEVDLEYLIEISNQSPLQCNELELIGYLPEGFGLDKESPFLTEEGNNTIYNWEKASVEELYNWGFITKDSYKKHQNQMAIVAHLKNDGSPDSFYISSGGVKQIKTIITTLLGGDLDKYDKSDFQIDFEVISYKDSGSNTNRRMASIGSKVIMKNAFAYETTFLSGIFQGNGLEHDHFKTMNDFTMTPPLGMNKTNVTGYIISASCLLPITLYGMCVLIKKTVKKKDK